MRTSPLSGCRSPASSRSAVDLPVPLGPTNASRSPGRISSEAPTRISLPGYAKPASANCAMDIGGSAGQVVIELGPPSTTEIDHERVSAHRRSDPRSRAGPVGHGAADSLPPGARLHRLPERGAGGAQMVDPDPVS